MNTVKHNLLYAGLEKEEFYRLMPQARRENEGKLKTYALVSFSLFFVLSIANMNVRIFPTGTIISYVVMALFSAAIYALARFLPSRRPSSTTALCYVFVGGLYAFSLVNNAMHPELPAIAAIAIMLMGPFLFTERPLNLIVMNLITVVLLCIISFKIKSRQFALIDLWDSFAFGVISVAAEITAENLRFRLLVQTDRIRYLSETDLPTGCMNRNYYLDILCPNLQSMCKNNLICAYIDVNGLHNLNDTQGHEAGDRMLKAVATALLDAFTKEHTYRVGGDEFIVMLPDGSLDKTNKKLTEVKQILANQGYYVSIGTASCASQPKLDLKALTDKAEEFMYVEKKKWYEQPGHERRKH